MADACRLWSSRELNDGSSSPVSRHWEKHECMHECQKWFVKPLWWSCICSHRENRWTNRSRWPSAYVFQTSETWTGSVTCVINQLISFINSRGALTDCRSDTPSCRDFMARTGPESRVSLESLFAKQVYSVSVICTVKYRLDMKMDARYSPVTETKWSFPRAVCSMRV